MSKEEENKRKIVWNCNEIAENASNWSLASDANLLKHLEAFSELIFESSRKIDEKLHGLTRKLDETTINLNLARNEFSSLSNTQFIESRVYEEDETSYDENQNKTGDDLKPNENPESNSKNDLKNAAKLGLEIISKYYNRVNVPVESDSDEEDDDLPGYILQPKDPYINRPLPYIIGSEEWYKSPNAGILDSSDSDSDEEKVSERYSDDSSSENEDLGDEKSININKTDNISDIYDDNVGNNANNVNVGDNGEWGEEIKANSTVNEGINAQNGTESPKIVSFAEQLAEKLGNVINSNENNKSFNVKNVDNEDNYNRRPIQTVKSDYGKLFSNEPPPIDKEDFFTDKTEKGGLFSGGNGLFDDLDDDVGFWGENSNSRLENESKNKDSSLKTEKSDLKPETSVKNKPIDDDSKTTSSKIVKESIKTSNQDGIDKKIVKESSGSIKNRFKGNLFDDDDLSSEDEDELFGDVNKFSKNAKAKVSKKPLQLKKDKKQSLFDDDSTDDDDFFVKKTVPKKNLTKENDLFDDEYHENKNIFEKIVKENNDFESKVGKSNVFDSKIGKSNVFDSKSEENNIFDSKIDKNIVFEGKTESKSDSKIDFFDSKDYLNNNNKNVNKNSHKKVSSLFSDSDSDDLFFKKTEKPKINSIFDEKNAESNLKIDQNRNKNVNKIGNNEKIDDFMINNDKIKENVKINKESDEYVKENDQILKENDQIVKGNDQILKENDQFVKENVQIVKENIQIVEENIQIVQENDQIVKENDQIVKENDHIVKENDQILKESKKIDKKLKEKEKIRSLFDDDSEEEGENDLFSNSFNKKVNVLQPKNEIINENENINEEKLKENDIFSKNLSNNSLKDVKLQQKTPENDSFEVKITENFEKSEEIHQIKEPSNHEKPQKEPSHSPKPPESSVSSKPPNIEPKINDFSSIFNDIPSTKNIFDDIPSTNNIFNEPYDETNDETYSYFVSNDEETFKKRYDSHRSSIFDDEPPSLFNDLTANESSLTRSDSNSIKTDLKIEDLSRSKELEEDSFDAEPKMNENSREIEKEIEKSVRFEENLKVFEGFGEDGGVESTDGGVLGVLKDNLKDNLDKNEEDEEKSFKDVQITSPGKLKHNLNINVKALLPGAAPAFKSGLSQAQKSKSLFDVSSINESENLSGNEKLKENDDKLKQNNDKLRQNVAKPAILPRFGVKSEGETPKINENLLESNLFNEIIQKNKESDGKSLRNEENTQNEPVEVLKSITKSRARIPVRRRPSTKKGREALRKSCIEFSTPNNEEIEEELSEEAQTINVQQENTKKIVENEFQDDLFGVERKFKLPKTKLTPNKSLFDDDDDDDVFFLSKNQSKKVENFVNVESKSSGESSMLKKAVISSVKKLENVRITQDDPLNAFDR